MFYNRILSNTDFSLYRVIQEERSVFWEVIVSVVVEIKVLMTLCVILRGYGYRWMDIWHFRLNHPV